MRKFVVGSFLLLIATCCSVPLMAQVAQPSPSDGTALISVTGVPLQEAAPVDAAAPAVASGDCGCCGTAAPARGFRMSRGSSCCDPCNNSSRLLGGRSWGSGRYVRRGNCCN